MVNEHVVDRVPVRASTNPVVASGEPGPLATAGRACRTYPIMVVLIFLAVLGLGLFLLANWPKTYMAQAIVTPPAELDRLNIQSGLSGIGGGGTLSSLAAMGGPQSAGMTRYETFVTLLSSRRVAQAMIRDHDALRRLYPDSWDEQNSRWKRPNGTFSRLMGSFKALMGFPGWRPPDDTTLAGFMTSHLKVTQSLKNTQRTISLSAKTSRLADDFLTWAMEESDAAVRADAFDRAKAQLRYVNDQLGQSITNTEDRTVLSEILMSTQRSVVLASTGSSFAEQVVQPPESSEMPSFPPFLASVVLIFLMAVAGGVGMAALRYRARFR